LQTKCHFEIGMRWMSRLTDQQAVEYIHIDLKINVEYNFIVCYFLFRIMREDQDM